MQKTVCLLFALLVTTGIARGAEAFQPEFFAFSNGVNFGPYPQEAQTLKELGYAGVGQVKAGGDNLAKRIAAYEAVGLNVRSIYLNVDDTPIAPEVVKPFENKGAMIELTVRKMTPNTVAAVRATAEMAAGMKIQVALYPHYGFAVATIPQAMDLIERVQHPNLGVMFNLCHFLRGETPDLLEQTLKAIGDRLFSVSTNGADTDGKSWTALIQPLDRGTFPQQRLFATLKQLNYTGPVGLQCYAIKGDKRENLARSMAAWKQILQDL